VSIYRYVKIIVYHYVSIYKKVITGMIGLNLVPLNESLIETMTNW